MWKNVLIVSLTTGWLMTLFWNSPFTHHRPATTRAKAADTTPSWGTKNAAQSAVATVLSDLAAAPGVEGASIGFCLLHDALEPEIAFNAGQSMTPASVLKTLTSGTALEILGPDFQFTTSLGFSAALTEAGVVEGDLIIRGGGDPLLGSDEINTWVGTLRRIGLTKLDGCVIADARHFPDRLAADFWDWGDISNYYGAGASGLNLDLNRFEVVHAPGKHEGAPADLVSIKPPLPWLRTINEVMTSAEDTPAWVSIYGGPYAETLNIRGTVPLGNDEVITQGAIPDPPFYAALTLTNRLREQGVEVSADPQTSRTRSLEGKGIPKPEPALIIHNSPPLPHIIRHLHRISDNMVTECLFLELSRQSDSGLSPGEVIITHWEKRGVSLRGLRMEDGSGLARANFIRPVDLARVLHQLRRGPHGAIFLKTLNTFADGRIHWKHGYMSRVHSLAGYVRSRNGSTYTFTLILNHTEPAFSFGPWRQRLIEALLELP